jgi:hypothetical protein
VTRDEFLALPPSLALGVLLDVFPSMVAKLANVEAPKVPRPPKYDFAIYRKDGIQWASETDVEGLRFWRDRYRESAEGGGQYADKDAKRMKALGFWIAWRICEPSTTWSGERQERHVTARPPSGKPEVYPRDARPADQDSRPVVTPSFDDTDEFGPPDDSGIPF